MADYLVLIKGGHTRHDALSDEEKGPYYARWGAYLESIRATGAFIGGGPLARSGTVLAGSFDNQSAWELETDRSVAGYLVITAADDAGALEAVRECPAYETGGTLEIRLIESM